MLAELQTGAQSVSDSTKTLARAGRQGDLIVSELHGRFYEQNFRGKLFSGGMALTSISAATFTTGTLGVTCTPIIGVWNPLSNSVNLVILQAYLNVIVTAATNTGPGGFSWATGTAESAISTGTTPFSRSTLLAAGSSAKDMCGIALTGKAANLVVRTASGLGGGSLANFSFVGTAVGQVTGGVGQTENLDGSFIVPPGGVLALLSNTQAVAHSAVAGLLWEEVPV